MVFTTEGFLEVAIESWPEWDLNPYICIYIYTQEKLLLIIQKLSFTSR